MTAWTLRPAALPDDFPRLAAIYSACAPEPTTVEDLVELEAKAHFEQRIRLVGVDETGMVAGLGVGYRYPEDPPGRYYVKAFVDTPFRGRGLGRLLADTMENWALEQGATSLDTTAREDSPRSVAFAQARGFAVEHHMFESTLDPVAFDETPFAGAVERAAATGIRFFTLTEAPGETSERKLYELYKITAPDIPGYDLVEFEPYELWHSYVITSKSARPDLLLIAADGERFVGCSALTSLDSGGLYTDYTCVLREYRGRGIALALKLLSIRVARAAGAPYLRTNNDSQNGPMLAVNRKLGFVSCPGFYRLRKRLG